MGSAVWVCDLHDGAGVYSDSRDFGNSSCRFLHAGAYPCADRQGFRV